MHCLNCGSEMVNYTVLTEQKQVSYDMCEACGSLWLDRGELDKMAFQVEGSIEFCSHEEAGGAPPTGKGCPRCDGVQLEKVRFLGSSDLMLDACPNCGGFWLDGGDLDLVNRELERIMPVEGKGLGGFVNNVHLPYWHKRIRRRSEETDFKLDVPPIQGAERVGESGMICPACHAGLDRYELYGMRLESCPRCHGIWLYADELRALKDRLSPSAMPSIRWMNEELDAIGKANAVPGRRLCPVCGDRKLLATLFGDSGLVIDWCPNCRGLWLDYHELQEILTHLREELERLSPAELKARIGEELKKLVRGPHGRGPRSLGDLKEAGAALAALVNATIFQHPRLFHMLVDLPAL
jgi:Zn-finger nucleic acid-binding protein